ncbi:site-specific integrase [Vibrio sp. 10N.286.51.E5]|uniref:site-specific integrase n=1 Tax=Vibrio sp. 10N.286.51.E5 TaxID=3229709 RepID=UPI00354B37B9
MRYLQLKPNGKWQFRFQIPPQFRQHFNHRREVKKTLHASSKQEAYILGIQHELAIKEYMSEITIGGTVTSFDEVHVREMVARMATKGISLIHEAVSRIQNDGTFKAALMQARDTQDACGGAEQVEGFFSLDLRCSGALGSLRSIYPDSVSPRKRAEQLVRSESLLDESAKGSAAFDLFFNKLIMVFKHLIDARISIENMELAQASAIAVQLKDLSVTDSQSATVREAHALVSSSIAEMFERGNAVRRKHDRGSSVAAKAVTPPESSLANTTPILTVDELEKSYLAEKANQKKSEKLQAGKGGEEINLADTKKAINRFKKVIALTGISDLSKISRDDAIEVVDILRMLPANPFNKKGKRHLFDANDVSSWVDVNKEAKLPTIQETTVGAYMEAASTIFNWAVKHQKLSYNPFRGIVNKRKGLNKDIQKSFSEDDLEKIFSHDVFTKLDLGTARNTNLPYQSRYWVPLLTILHGMRPNEAAQLQGQDVLQIKGIWCLRITDEGKHQSVKNKNSRRIIPIHKVIIEKGFLTYIKGIGKDGQLFPELVHHNSEHFMKRLGDWFRTYISEPNGFTMRSLGFYNFRHTFINHFKQNGVSDVVPAEIVGHLHQNFTYNNYGDAVDVVKMKEHIDGYQVPALNQVQPMFQQ